MSTRPALLFYCQHSLGMGHLVRSLALADVFGEHFRVVLLNGGPLPKAMKTPDGIEIVNLPPIGLDADGKLVSRDRRRTVESAQTLRRQIIFKTYQTLRPNVVFVELFPFGRRKFAAELLPMLDEARNSRPSRPLVCCSLRDILVGEKSHQQKHDDRAVEIANDYFDAVLVHSDPSFARLEESLLSYQRLHVPTYYTGFVEPNRARDGELVKERKRQILVSVGGGLVGETLIRRAIEAFVLFKQSEYAGMKPVSMKVVTGPFLPEEAWKSLSTHRQPDLSLKRFVPDLRAEMRNSIASISQAGYNTTLDILRSGVPSLVVPFADGVENEQLKRARLLEKRGAIRILEQQEITAARLAKEMRELLTFSPQVPHLDFEGALNTRRIVESLISAKRQRSVASVDENSTRRRYGRERVA